MNATSINYQDKEIDYQVDHRRNAGVKLRRSRQCSYSRSSRRPASFNGIHRRRAKRWNW